MKRPKEVSGEQGAYILFLEKQLEKYQSKKTLVNSYLSLKQMVDDINSILRDGLEYPDGTKKPLISHDTLSSKDDKLMDRLFKFVDNLGKYNKDLKDMELDVLPELKEQEENYGGDLEKALHIGHDR